MFQKKILIAATALLLILTLLLFFPALRDPAFLSDDLPNVYLVDAAARSGRLASYVVHNFTTSFSTGGNFYRPMIGVAHALDYALWQSNATGWHFTNFALHLLSILGVTLLTYQLGRRAHIFHAWLPAILAGALFTVRPLIAEATLWVSSRGDLLAMVGILLALVGYLRAQGRWNRWYALGWVGYLLGLLSKEPAATVPGALAGFHIAELLSGNAKLTRRYISDTAKLLLPFVLLLALYMGWRTYLFGSPLTVYDNLPPVDLANPEWREGKLTALHYFFAPMRATLDEEHVRESDPLLLLTVAPLLVGGILAFAHRRVRLVWVFGAIWLLATLLPAIPTLTIANREGERLFYISVAPLALLLVAPLFAHASDSDAKRATPRYSSLFAGTGALLALLLILYSVPILQARLAEWGEAGRSMNALIAAIPPLARNSGGNRQLLVIPDSIEGVLFGRNAEGALLRPPLQSSDFSGGLTIIAPQETCRIPEPIPPDTEFWCWDVTSNSFRPLDPHRFDEEQWEEAWEFD